MRKVIHAIFLCGLILILLLQAATVFAATYTASGSLGAFANGTLNGHVNSGERVTINACASNFFAVRVYDPSATEIGSGYATFGPGCSDIGSFMASSTGTYRFDYNAANNPVTFSLTITAEIPPPDDDNDSVPNSSDNCPSVSNANQANMDGDSLGDACDPDIDGDGVNNGADQCPGFDDNADADSDGTADGCDAFPNDNENDGVDDGAEQ
jgi:hypothetical protein